MPRPLPDMAWFHQELKRPVITDPSTGELIAVERFVGALGASSYVYAEVCASQDLPAWLAAHVRMVEFFGGAPALVVPDNLLSGVLTACHYDPVIKGNFLPGRDFLDDPHFHEQLSERIATIADVGVHGTTHARPIDRFAKEQAALVPTGGHPRFRLEAPLARIVAEDWLVSGRHQPLLGALHPLLARR